MSRAAKMPRHLTAALAALALSGAAVGAQGSTIVEPYYERSAIGAHVGFVSIEDAKNASELGLSAEFGSLRWPWLRTVVGLDYLRSSSTRANADGTFQNIALNLELRATPLQIGKVVPYIGGGLGVHFRSTNASDPNVADIYDGVVVGAQGFLGALMDLREDATWGLSTELRTVAAQNIGRTSLRLGVFRRF